ncbi:MAG: conjugal transfer protein TrbC [Sphingomonadales bacterium]|nr:conjugal transfer protein TrbC [Sphingomonadales bacterium]MDE2170167.1 conjugal transfer protein TrbC [Sphingomonadales bacterium]
MPICKSSANRMPTPSPLAVRRGALALGLILGALSAMPAPALAQESSQAPNQTPNQPPSPKPSANAREKVQLEGDAALERLRHAVAGQKARGAASAPAALPAIPEPIRRRAFEAMHAHVPSPAMDARARAALDAGKAAFAVQRDAMARRLNQALGLEAPDMAALARAAAPKAADNWVPVLFVSSSMPITTLRAFAVQLEKARGVMAFRGMLGGLTHVAPMAKLSAEILRLESGCEGPACAMRNVQLIVDPIVFRQHGIAQVPALVMIPGDPTQPYCERGEDASDPATLPKLAGAIVYGDAALSGMLEEYARLGGKEEVRDAQSRLESR